MAQSSGNEQRMSMRVDPDQKALIERGAKARGLSVTDFVLTLALREAEIALTERSLFTLDEDSYQRFQAIMERPAREKPELTRMLERNRKSKWVMKT